MNVDMMVWPGPYPYKRGAVDPNVTDAESAFYHEWSVHLLRGWAAAKKVLEKFERKEFKSKAKCEAAMNGAIAKAKREFTNAAKKSPL